MHLFTLREASQRVDSFANIWGPTAVLMFEHDLNGAHNTLFCFQITFFETFIWFCCFCCFPKLLTRVNLKVKYFHFYDIFIVFHFLIQFTIHNGLWCTALSIVRSVRFGISVLYFCLRSSTL